MRSWRRGSSSGRARGSMNWRSELSAKRPAVRVDVPFSDLNQQRPKAGLNKVVVGRESVSELMFLHHDERQAIGETPGFVGALAEQLHRIVQSRPGRFARAAARVATVKLVPYRHGDRTMVGMRKRGGDFQQNGIGGPQLTTVGNRAGELLGLGMVLIAAVEPRDDVAGVEKESITRIVHRISLAPQKDNDRARPPNPRDHRSARLLPQAVRIN